MTESLKHQLMPRITRLHESLCRHLKAHQTNDVLGDHLSRLCGGGTGRSVVMLAILSDVLQAIDIAIGQQPTQFPEALSHVASFCRSAVNAFARKSLPVFLPYRDMSTARLPQFLKDYRENHDSFTPGCRHTQWSALHLCRHVASKFHDQQSITLYDALFHELITQLMSTDIASSQEQTAVIAQLSEFVSDHCADLTGTARSQRSEQQTSTARRQQFLQDWETRLGVWEQQLRQQQAALDIARAELETERNRLNEERRDVDALRRRFQRPADRSEENEYVEEQSHSASEYDAEAERAELWQEREELALEQERLIVWQRELEATQRKLDCDLQALDEFQADSGAHSDGQVGS